MITQNFQNHSTLKSPTRTFIMYVVAMALLLILTTINLLHAFSSANDFVLAVIITLIVFVLLISYFLFRSYSLKAQDRAIRAEENLRHFVLTGKLLSNQLKITQIVALRFASNEEFVELAERAVKDNLSNKEIKMAIKNWRGDYHRA